MLVITKSPKSGKEYIVSHCWEELRDDETGNWIVAWEYIDGTLVFEHKGCSVVAQIGHIAGFSHDLSAYTIGRSWMRRCLKAGKVVDPTPWIQREEARRAVRVP